MKKRGRKRRINGIHPLAELIPERTDEESLMVDIGLNGVQEPIYTYEKQIIEGRVRWRACKRLQVNYEYKDWVLLGEGDPLDWMVRKHVATYDLSQLEKIKLVAAVLPEYREMKGSTHQRLYKAIGLPWNKIRIVDWLEEAGALGPVLSGELDLADAARKAGLAGDKREIALGKSYGAGDKFDEALQPIKRYLAAWKRKGYEFRHLNPKEAARRLSLIESLVEELQAAKPDLEMRAVESRYSAPPERKTRK